MCSNEPLKNRGGLTRRTQGYGVLHGRQIRFSNSFLANGFQQGPSCWGYLILRGNVYQGPETSNGNWVTGVRRLWIVYILLHIKCKLIWRILQMKRNRWNREARDIGGQLEFRSQRRSNKQEVPITWRKGRNEVWSVALETEQQSTRTVAWHDLNLPLIPCLLTVSNHYNQVTVRCGWRYVRSSLCPLVKVCTLFLLYCTSQILCCTNWSSVATVPRVCWCHFSNSIFTHFMSLCYIFGNFHKLQTLVLYLLWWSVIFVTIITARMVVSIFEQ